jgi:hypothetical protein
MKIKTLAVGGAVAVLGLGVLQLATGQIGPQAKSGGSASMAPARKVQVPDERDKARVIIQACFYPADKDQLVTVPWKLGSEQQYDIVRPPMNCQTPWARSALLKAGDVISVGWILNRGPVAKFKARITINNRVAINASDVINRATYECTLGLPPCGF